MVLNPVADLLANRRLLIVADGALQYIPFAALPEPAAEEQPLIVDHEIVNLPSASTVAVLRRAFGDRQRADRLVAVLADPVFDPTDPRLKAKRPRAGPAAPVATAPDVDRVIRSVGLLTDRGTLSRLPFTRDEADAILALAPAGQVTRAVDFKANRAAATGTDLSRYRVVHLATHGLLDAEHPELSGIVLSLVDEHGAPQDGVLRLHEVYNLKWSAELVVLSACQTALGKEIRGEGLIGLTRGFMYAGAERVLASLWNVNDGATAQFMKRFYQGLFTQGLRPAAALRAAQVEMWRRQSTRAPYYWAAFVLQGDWK
jgi:CHAT domain-containing protein